MAAPAVCTTKFTLNNGTTMPAVGLGTWQGNVGTDDSEALEKSIAHALDSGYRLIDTAHAYGVEAIVGRAVRASKVPRSDICVVTKFWGEWHHDPAEALRMSLAELGLDYVDVLLMHWPWATTPASDGKKPLKIDQSPTIVETWRLMEKLVGPQCRAIGVSNFTQKTLDKLIAECSVVPAVNQVELHALNPNSKLVPYCDSKGIRVMSWSTLGGDRKGQRNPILTHEIFTSIAEAHGCSTGVVSLSWAVQRGVVVIPKSSSPKRIEDNIKLVTLSDDEMHRINTAHEVIGRERMADGIVLLQVQMDGKKTLQGWSAVDFGWEDEQGNWLV